MLVGLFVLAAVLVAGVAIVRVLRQRDTLIDKLERRNDWLERRVEQAHRPALFDSGPVIMLAFEAAPPHALRDASPNLQRARGSAQPAPPIGRPLAELLHPDDAASLAAALAQAAADPGQRVQREVRLWHDAGNWRWQLLQLAADRAAADGEPLLRGYLVGIDALKQAESQAAARRRDLEELVQKMSASQRFLQSLQQLGEQLQLCDSEVQAGAIVSRAGPELFARWDGALSFADAGGAMTLAARWGDFAEPRKSREADCWALRRGRLHRASGNGSPRERAPVCAHFGDAGALPPGVTQAICVPLLTPSGRPGALHLLCRDDLDDEQVRAAAWGAEAVTDALRQSLANLHLRLSLHEQAVRDWLTGLYNRRHFDETLKGEIDRARRAGDNLTLALLDIDHFKSFNDTFGHQAGDEVLKAVAAELRGFVRSYDLACRVGGEELALLLPRAPLDETCVRLDRLRENIGRLALRHDGVALPAITVSIGVADTLQGASDDLLRRADVALYAAKHAGRNRLACWEPALDGGSDAPLAPRPADSDAPRLRRRDVL